MRLWNCGGCLIFWRGAPPSFLNIIGSLQTENVTMRKEGELDNAVSDRGFRLCNLCMYFLAVLDPKLIMFAFHSVARQPINIDFVTILNERVEFVMSLLSHPYIYSKFFHSPSLVFAWKMKYALAELHGIGSCTRIRLLLPSPRHKSCAPCSTWHPFNKTSLFPFLFHLPFSSSSYHFSRRCCQDRKTDFYTEVIATAVHCRNSVDVNM